MTLASASQIANIIYTLLTAGLLLVAWIQLSKLRNELKMNSLMAILEMESQMNSRKEKVDDVGFRMRNLEIEGKLSDSLKDILSDEYHTAVENWINSVDRLAYCILKKYLEDRDWRSEYRDYVQNLVKEFESRFGAGSRYTNIIDLNNKWKRE